jgi:hypothetical protein
MRPQIGRLSRFLPHLYALSMALVFTVGLIKPDTTPWTS